MIRDLDFFELCQNMLGVLNGENSLYFIAAMHFPSFIPRANCKPPYKYKGIDFYSIGFPCVELDLLSSEIYTIPECHVNPGDIVFDCGAYNGIFSYMAVHNQASSVYAFEPTKETFSVLEKNIELWNLRSKIFPVNVGVYSENKNLPFYLGDNPPSNSLYTSLHCDAHERTTETGSIPLTTLDSFVKENGIGSVDFIKMDIEGAEIEAIKGAKNIIEEYKPRMAISGYHRENDLIDIPNCVLGFREDYSYKIVNKGELDIYFW